MGPAERLVGRGAVLAAAELALLDAKAGSGQFLMIRGEAGIGKTALLATLTDRDGPDVLVLRGGCWEGVGAPPYWPWTQALRGSDLTPAQLGEAGWLLDTGSAPIDLAGAAASADALFRTFDAVDRCLRGVAANAPVMIVLDDLHWSDEPSLRMLGSCRSGLVEEQAMLHRVEAGRYPAGRSYF
jgi:hypothetical protein